MIPVVEIANGEFVAVSNNIMLTRDDGEVRVPFRTAMHESWSDDDRSRFGLFLAQPFVLPEGMQTIGERRFERVNGIVHELYDTEEIPAARVEIDRRGLDVKVRIEALEAEVASLKERVK